MKRSIKSYSNRLFNSKVSKERRKDLRNRTTRSENIIWYYLRRRQLNSYKFRRQYSIGKFIVDFYCPEIKLVIEVNGANHFFDSKSATYDLSRQKFIENKDIKVIKILTTDIFNNIERVIESILTYLKTSPSFFFESRENNEDNMTKTATILDGKKIAEEIKKDLKEKILKLKNKPGLAAILVGNNPASESYINLKEKSAQKIGINFHKYLCNEKCCNNISEKELIKLIKFLNQDQQTDGILIQLPLPSKYNTQKIIKTIDIKKDVDGFVSKNKNIIPPTIGAIIELLKSTKEKLENKKTLIIGKSDIFVKGIEKYLKSELKIKSINSKKSIPKDSKNYDIIIIALGKANSLKKSMIKPDSIIIDVGINKTKSGLVGDVDPKVAEVASYLSPVPGGVGPLTVACVLRNTFLLSQK